MKYPCRECLVSICCGMLCDDLQLGGGDLLYSFEKNRCCPDCGNEFFEWYGGDFNREATRLTVWCEDCRHVFDFDLFYNPIKLREFFNSFHHTFFNVILHNFCKS